MRDTHETKTIDRLTLSLLAFGVVVVMGLGYELIAHGADIENRAAFTVYMTAMFAAWATAVFWPNES